MDDDVPPDEEDLYSATPVRARTAVVPIRPAPEEEEDPDDLDALMAEAEMGLRGNTSTNGPTRKAAPPDDDDEDDLDALMAEADAETQRRTANNTGNQAPAKAAPADDDFEDDEAAMAEMGGLW